MVVLVVVVIGVIACWYWQYCYYCCWRMTCHVESWRMMRKYWRKRKNTIGISFVVSKDETEL